MSDVPKDSKLWLWKYGDVERRSATPSGALSHVTSFWNYSNLNSIPDFKPSSKQPVSIQRPRALSDSILSEPPPNPVTRSNSFPRKIKINPKKVSNLVGVNWDPPYWFETPINSTPFNGVNCNVCKLVKAEKTWCFAPLVSVSPPPCFLNICSLCENTPKGAAAVKTWLTETSSW